jgi:tetratricopeptide (TPR) repeat protein
MDPRIFVVIAGIGGAAALQDGLGEANAVRRMNDFRYSPDPRVMRVVAGAHRSTTADLVWLRALPDMSRQFKDRALKKRWLAAATEAVTDLEPSFGTVYSYGAAHLTLIDRNPDAAIKLLSKGIEKNPDSAGLHVALAMVYYEFKKDKAKTIELLDKASTMPDIDSLSLAMLASMKVDAHDDFVAIAYWAQALECAPNAKTRTICEHDLWFTKRLIANRASREYQAAHDKTPPKTADDVRDPKLMDPKVFDIVLPDLVFDAKGVANYARLVELERTLRISQADDFVAAFREGEGRAPTEEEFLRQFGDLPDPPEGKKWKFADGTLSLADK